VRHGRRRLALFSQPGGERLRDVLEEGFSDYELQMHLLMRDMDHTRRALLGHDKRLTPLLDKQTDEQLETILTDLGGHDTHELPNSLTWGPDGWLYGRHGIQATSFVGRPYVAVKINAVPQASVPGLSRLPLVGTLLFTHDVLVYGAYLLAPLIWFLLFHTKWGLALRAVGERQAVAYASGLPTSLIQHGAVVSGGVLSGIAGAHLSLAYARSWVEGMSNGRGFIAVALVIFATWHPLRSVVGAVVFGSVFALQLQIQARGVALSPYFLDMTPYLLTLVGLLLMGRARRHAMPEGLKAVFEGVT
jgi:hypothetical protein